MKFVRFAAIILCLCCFGEGSKAATTLLPNGKQCFAGVNGAYSSGSLNMFIPNTTTPKATWQDPNQQTLNSQPISLDANGCAIIYGVGQYTQQLYDGPVVGGVTTGNQIWSQLTTDTSAYNSVFWAGTALATGTPNAIQITDVGFNGTDGSVVQFVALATNTGSTTINPSGFGNILVQKSTTAGPVSLIGGEIVAGNVISAVYSASSNTFQLLNAVIQSASGATAPLCGATGLKITNNSSTPNTIINLTADQIVMLTSAGLVQSRGNVSLTAINISTGTSTSTANGMDGEAPGTSQWLYIYAIDNGAAPAGLVSTSATAPTLPSGYTFKCRLGAMRVDGSGNLLRTVQYGAKGQYTPVQSSNTTTYPVAVSGVSGTCSTGNYTSISLSALIPATAPRASVALAVSGAVTAEADPTNNVNVIGTPPIPAMGVSGVASSAFSMTEDLDLVTASTIFYCSNGANSGLSVHGWTDKVNAH